MTAPKIVKRCRLITRSPKNFYKKKATIYEEGWRRNFNFNFSPISLMLKLMYIGIGEFVFPHANIVRWRHVFLLSDSIENLNEYQAYFEILFLLVMGSCDVWKG